MRFFSFVAAVLVPTTASPWTALAAAAEPLGAPCSEACLTTFRSIKYTDSDGTIPRVKQCKSPLAIASLYLCLRAHCTAENRLRDLNAQNKTCQNSYGVSLPPWEIISNYTDDDLTRVRTFEKPDMEAGETYSEAAMPSAHLFGLAYDTLKTWSYVFSHHLLYGFYLFVFWGIVVAIGLASRILGALSRLQTRKRLGWQNIPLEEPDEGGEPTDKPVPRVTRPYAWLQHYVTVPATFGYRAAQPFGWYTVPPRVQSLTILAFVLMNVFFCCYGYHTFPDNLYWNLEYRQLWRYISDRTGIVSYANFPLIWLFGMRNNLLLSITGWDFGTYNNFHRWVARVSTAEAVVHSLGYTFLVFVEGGWPYFVQYWHNMWWTTGEIATILMCALIPLSLYWMRRNVYELFLLVHIGFSVIILATMWGHISVFEAHYSTLIWICSTIWVFDRALRVGRSLAFNRRFWNTRARATYDPSANIIRLSIPCGSCLYRPKPGTYYYLQLLNDARFWESHPFTMAKIQEQDEIGDPTDDAAGSDEAASLLPRSGASSPSALETSHHHHPPRTQPAMTFLIRPYDSFTKRLRDAAYATYPRPAYLPMLVEGPYGHCQPFRRFSNLLFLVGGSGIVVPLVYLESLCKATASTKSIHVVWAVREPAFAASVLERDFGSFHDAIGSGKLRLDVYVTRAHRSQQWQDLPKDVRVIHGRPDATAQVEDAVRTHGRLGSVAVVACGPSRMNDDARKAVADSIGKGRYAIEYFEESFNW